MRTSGKGFRRLATVQGIYFCLTGVWPLASPLTFQAVTGPKVDFWLVNTVGVLVLAVGLTLLHAGTRLRDFPSIRLLGILSAAGLAGIDVYYVAEERISPIYLADAGVEGVLILFWLLVKPPPP